MCKCCSVVVVHVSVVQFLFKNTCPKTKNTCPKTKNTSPLNKNTCPRTKNTFP